MKGSVILGLMALLCIEPRFSLGWAEEPSMGGSGETILPSGAPEDCQWGLRQYFHVEGETSIPDGDPTGAWIGPVVVPDQDCFTFGDLIVEVGLTTHTWLGDLGLRLWFDSDSEGVRYGPVALVCRQGLEGCDMDGAACCGCHTLVEGKYYFQDAASRELGEGCPESEPRGCYRPAYDSPNPLSFFNGLNKGGRWWLEAVDAQCGATAAVTSFGLYFGDCGATNVMPTSWGTLKSIYRD